MKCDAYYRMSDLHEKIKYHPYRRDFAAEYAGDYNQLMYELSEAWSDYIWNESKNVCDEYTQKKLRMFNWWIHDYRQSLGYNSNFFPRQYFYYYEQMLQITHRFLETGNFDRFFEIRKVGDTKKSIQNDFITEDNCGIASKILPRYLPVRCKYIVDPDIINNYFDTYWYYKNMSEEDRNNVKNFWNEHTRPVLEKLNADADKVGATIELPIYASIIVSESSLYKVEETK